MASAARIEPREVVSLMSIIEGLETTLSGLTALATAQNQEATADHIKHALVSLANAEKALTDPASGAEMRDEEVSPTIPWLAETPRNDEGKVQELSLITRGELFVDVFKRPRTGADPKPRSESDLIQSVRED